MLLENNKLRSALNRIYYGMFYALTALAISHQFATSKHSQLLGWFNKNFIHTGLIENKYGIIINKAYNSRMKSDYDTYIKLDSDIINEMYEEMILFINEIKLHTGI